MRQLWILCTDVLNCRGNLYIPAIGWVSSYLTSDLIMVAIDDWDNQSIYQWS
jgi:hypothetical protein